MTSPDTLPDWPYAQYGATPLCLLADTLSAAADKLIAFGDRAIRLCARSGEMLAASFFKTTKRKEKFERQPQTLNLGALNGAFGDAPFQLVDNNLLVIEPVSEFWVQYQEQAYTAPNTLERAPGWNASPWLMQQRSVSKWER